MKNDLDVILLRYEEDGAYESTTNSLRCAGIKEWIEVDREGVGNMAAAFNRGIALATKPFVWLVTNVTFAGDVPRKLLNCLQDTGAVGVHPKFTSDHPFLAYATRRAEVPFIEFTAPMIRKGWLYKFGPLNEKLPYWGMDLDWSFRARSWGGTLYVEPEAVVKHQYLRHNDSQEDITLIRAALRSLRDESTIDEFERLYSEHWQTLVWPTSPDMLNLNFLQ